MKKTALILSFVLAASLASAADPVTDALQKAYVPYRVALFKTSNNLLEDSRKAIAQARKEWNDIAVRYKSSRPSPYDLDTAFLETMTEVADIYAKAAAQIEKNQLAEAHGTLEMVREETAALRHRNQVIVFSDHMNAYHAQMELVLNDGMKILAEPNGLSRLTAQVGVLEYLAASLNTEAPADYSANDEFIGMYKAVEKSVADLSEALVSQNTEKIKTAIDKTKVPYSKMFVKFG